MNRVLQTLFVAAVLSGAAAHAEPPRYIVLQAPVAPYDHHRARHHHVPPAPVTPVYRQPYAYGWFGAAPRRQWSRHFGYHRAYTQWSAR